MVYIKSYSSVYKNEKSNSSASDIALAPAKEVLEGFDVSKIDALICATVTKDYVYPSTACMLAGKLGINNAFCFDIESDFTGFLSAIKLASAFIKSNRYNNILVVATESVFMCTDDEVFSDGAAVVLLTNEKSSMTVDFVDCATDGGNIENCYVPMGGSAKPYTKEGIKNKEHFIKMKDSNVFVNAAKDYALYAKDVLSKHNIDVRSLLYVTSSSSKEVYETFVSSLQVDRASVYYDEKSNKSYISASSGIYFVNALKERFINSGSKVAICAFGSNFTKAIAVVNVE